EIMSRAQINPGARTDVKRVLRELVRAGTVLKEGKRYAVAGAKPAEAKSNGRSLTPALSLREKGTQAPRVRGLVGTLKVHRDGFGFIARLDRQGEDVYVSVEEARKAMDGDLVRFELMAGSRGRTAGRIV